jgi:hypothetical protein
MERGRRAEGCLDFPDVVGASVWRATSRRRLEDQGASAIDVNGGRTAGGVCGGCVIGRGERLLHGILVETLAGIRYTKVVCSGAS